MACNILGSLMLTLLTLGACGGEPDWEFHSLTLQQPTVLQVDPAPEFPLDNPAHFMIRFSERLDMQSLLPASVALIHGEWPDGLEQDPGEIIEALEENTLDAVPLNFTLEGEETTLHLTPKETLEPGSYHLTVTPRLLSTGGVPFNQTPGSSPRGYVAHYSLGTALGDSGSFGPPPDSLVINEILYDGILSESDGEAFVELFGTPGGDIGGYEIRLLNGADGAVTDTVAMPHGSLLDAQGIFVIADLKTNSLDSTRVPIFHHLDHFDPQNGPDAVQLVDRGGRVVDAVAYGEGGVLTTQDGTPMGEGEPAADVLAGHSISRVSGQDSQDNRRDFIDLETPTPGRP